MHDFGFVALDFKYTRPDDSGTYTCRAINSLGTSDVSANLQVMSAKSGPQGESLHGEALQKIAYLEQKNVQQGTDEEDGVASAPVFVVPLQGILTDANDIRFKQENRFSQYWQFSTFYPPFLVPDFLIKHKLKLLITDN